MPKQKIKEIILPGILNSYSIIFFFNHRLLASVLLVISFFNLYSGLSGFIAVCFSVVLSYLMGMDKLQIRQGIYSFNALLTGMGMGVFYEFSWVYLSLLLLASLVTLILSVNLNSWLGKYGLPFLSIPFVFTFWLIILPASQYDNLGLTQRGIYWMNEVYAVGGNPMLHALQYIDSLPVPEMLSTYFRSLSSIFFQDNLISGLLLSITLLICSRITFSLSIVGFITAYGFAKFTGSDASVMSYYNIGANYMLVAIAMGGVYIIPSLYSYLWAVLLVPITTALLLFMSRYLEFFQLPVFSLPFSLVVIFFIYFLMQRVSATKIRLTPFQYFSPETNLYTFTNNNKRLSHLLYTPLHLPFWGKWSVSQSHDGSHTHKGDWRHAYDFTILDENGKSYRGNGALCEDYYCYNKPVLAPADGFVELIVDQVDENEIGKIDTHNNWGNSIIIKHNSGLYSQISHLKKGTFKIKSGDFVKKGDLLALCGNSGRSPEPHLHIQLQSIGVLGAKTIDYPFAYFLLGEDGEEQFMTFSKLEEKMTVENAETQLQLRNAFDILPNSQLRFRYQTSKGESREIEWEAFTDSYNEKYLYCRSSGAVAYYVNDRSMFYFTNFYGDKRSLLYAFYQTAFRVYQSTSPQIKVTDSMPLSLLKANKVAIWWQDFIAPFYTFIHLRYTSQSNTLSIGIAEDTIVLNSEINRSVFGNQSTVAKGTITIENSRITSFTFQSNHQLIQAICIE